jgi:hypothetical protein
MSFPLHANLNAGANKRKVVTNGAFGDETPVLHALSD